MSQAFRELLKKIGSGVHTGKNLSRVEARSAMLMMLNQEATPAQIGAFLIAHRIKRPTAEELAGILDAYDQLGPKVPSIATEHPVLVLSVPYDGRSRTASVLPLTALILATAGYPVLMHGGNQMPTKYGVPLVELWQGLGVNWAPFHLEQIQQLLAQNQLGFIYLPQHFPPAEGLVPYREQIGKRPPLATTELLWCPYAGEAHVISGFVHPPTEKLFQQTFALRGVTRYTTVKGLEGSCELPRDRTAIIGVHTPKTDPNFQRLLLSARNYGLGGKEVPYQSTETLLEQMHQVLQGETPPLLRSVLWNGGFYLWHVGLCADLTAGIARAEALLQDGQVLSTLQRLQTRISHCPRQPDSLRV